MKFIFVLILLAFGFVDGKPTSSVVKAVAQVMEAEMPGSVDEFVAWGREEALLEQYFDILSGAGSVPPNFRPFGPAELRYLTMYLRPSTTMAEHTEILRRAVVNGLVECPSPIEDQIAKQNHLLEILFIFPDQLFFVMSNIMNDSRRANIPIDYSRIAAMYAPVGTVAQFESRLRVWDRICFSDPNLQECYRDGTGWKLRESGKSKMFRHLAWSAVSKRVKNSRH